MSERCGEWLVTRSGRQPCVAAREAGREPFPGESTGWGTEPRQVGGSRARTACRQAEGDTRSLISRRVGPAWRPLPEPRHVQRQPGLRAADAGTEGVVIRPGAVDPQGARRR